MKTVLFCHDTYYSIQSKDTVRAYGAFPYALWRDRFLPHFNHVTIIGREKPAHNDDKTDQLDQSAGPSVTHILLPNINTPLKRIVEGRKTYQTIKDQVAKVDGIIIRGPTEFGMMAARAARQLGKPYAIEMSGCAFDHTWNHGSLIGKLYAPIKYLRARNMVKHATQAIYVTKYFLQKRYPVNGQAANASNVEIKQPAQSILENRLTRIKSMQKPRIIGLIGNYGNKLKGLHIALKALSLLKKDGLSFQLRILGKGNPAQWQAMIKDLNLEDNIEFSGTLPGGEAVLNWLDAIDIYIQPSFHEGLPRAVIEAMSRGLPCLTSNAGGTDEMLPTECIHRKGEVKALYAKLKNIWSDQDWLTTQAKQNFATAGNYTKETLAPIRASFWQSFKSKL